MERGQKKVLVQEITEKLNASDVVIVVHYQGMTVAEVTDLRKKIRSLGAGFKVTKNNMAKIAVQDSKFANTNVKELFSGPTAISYSKDPVAAAKAVVQYSKDNEKLVILGGAYGEQALDVSGIKSLAELPSLDELRARIIGMIKTPATRIASIVQAPGGQVARVLSAYSKK